jgi:hypothetical protein
MKEVLTVGYLRDKLKDLPDNYEVRGYEGEGGAWIIIEKPEEGFRYGEEVFAFKTRS